MKISEYQTALLVALMFNRSGLKRGRLTAKTLCVISGRNHLRSHFIVQLQDELDDLGLILFESGRGFGLIRYSLLDGAMVLSESSHIAEELFSIEVDRDYDFSDIKEELGLIEPKDTTQLDDDFNFDDEDEPVIIKKPKKKHGKKTKKMIRDEQQNLEQVQPVSDEDDEFNF